MLDMKSIDDQSIKSKIGSIFLGLKVAFIIMAIFYAVNAILFIGDITSAPYDADDWLFYIEVYVIPIALCIAYLGIFIQLLRGYYHNIFRIIPFVHPIYLLFGAGYLYIENILHPQKMGYFPLALFLMINILDFLVPLAFCAYVNKVSSALRKLEHNADQIV